ncbi:uncharacterized protein LOC101856162 isoform X2 [Aplysia californica]|uniref:Uncharacterized protein LOC101856162 isoform X2 n=1 Tax=Aplysia californica TaxID=6500 RepID=A0ABM0JFQ2_APLCA|nr:uncharacterized protein LOC101856162 isoform X2 [Aplysia californica]
MDPVEEVLLHLTDVMSASKSKSKSKSKYADVSQYLFKVLSFSNWSSMVSVSGMAMVSDLCNKDKDEGFRKAAIDNGVVKQLVGILSRRNEYFHGSVEQIESLLKPKSPQGSLDLSEDSTAVRVPLQTTLALKCIYEFCSIYSIHHYKFLDESFLQCLLGYLTMHRDASMNNFQSFYQFGPSFTMALKDIVRSYGFDMKVSANWDSPINAQGELLFYKPAFMKVKDVQLKSRSVWYVTIRDGSLNPDSDLHKRLIKEKVAWEKGLDLGEVGAHSEWRKNGTKNAPESPTASLELTALKWKSCCVTSVVNGNFLWALLGDDTIKTASAISSSLKKDLPSLKKAKPHPDDVVVVEAQSPSERDVFRARVVEAAGGVVTVFGVDSGVMRKVPIHCVYALPSHLTLEEIPATVSLVRLKGINPPPVDPRGVELAAASLMLVSRNSINTCSQLLELDLLTQFPDLIHSPDPHVSCQALSLAATLVTGKARKCCKKWLKILFATLVVLNRCVQRQLQHAENQRSETTTDKVCQKSLRLSDISPADNSNIISSCLQLLVNRLYMCREAKNFFYRVQGLDVVMNAYAVSKRNLKLKKWATLVFCNFVHVTTSRRGLPDQGRKNGDERSSSSDSVPSMKAKTKQSEMNLGSRAEQLQALEEESDDEDADDSGIADDNFFPHVAQDGAVMDIESCLKNGNVPFYVAESFVSFRPDDRHELFQTAQLNMASFATVICGMLNTGHEGTIYLGISETGQVDGVELSHDFRDDIRLGVDKIMMSRLTPTVLHSQFKVIYVPVVKWVGDDKERHVARVANRYVVEISFKPVPKVIYCCKGDESYYRTGSTTMKLSQQDVRHMIVIEEEAWHRDQIISLQKQLKELKDIDDRL